MSRSGYGEGDDENGAYAMWHGTILSATRGKRGQAFFRALVEALDAMPVKELIDNELETDEGAVCALGALAKHRGAVLSPDDTYDYDKLGETFNIARQLAQEVMHQNDEGAPPRGPHQKETPAERWTRIRGWAEMNCLLVVPPRKRP